MFSIRNRSDINHSEHNSPRANEEKGVSPWLLILKKFRVNKMAMFGIAILALLAIMVIAAPFVTIYERNFINLENISQSPSAQHWLGTDELGRDVYTRLVYGSRVSLGVGFVATVISLLLGVTLGTIAGYYGGLVDGLIMRVADVFMCFPFFVLAISIAAALGPSIRNVVLIIGVLGWTTIGRISRAEILSLKQREFVEAARALGLSSHEIIIKHLLPNILAPILVYITLSIANAILTEAALSFLGLGVSQPQPSWGNMLSSAQSMRALRTQWWLWVPPGIMVVITVLSINLVGDGLRDALDVKLKV